MASENAGHGPGSMASDGAIKQHKVMAMGKGVMGGTDFGVAGFSRVQGDVSMNHGAHMPHDGVVLTDDGRGTAPAIERGKTRMAATAAPDHGPHHHRKHMR